MRKNAREKNARAAAQRKAAVRARSGVDRRKPEPAAAPAYPIGKGRKALKGISIYMHPLAKDVLDKIAREQDLTVQELGLEALNLLFRHYGQKPIA
jgi:Antitoxin-like ribbon-helix-helix